MRLFLIAGFILCFLFSTDAFQHQISGNNINRKLKKLYDSTKNIDIPYAPNEALHKAADSNNGTIYFTSPANGTSFLYHAPIPVSLATSDGGSATVIIAVNCPDGSITLTEGNSSDTLYVTTPYESGVCNATITSSPGYTAINYVQFSIITFFCSANWTVVDASFNKTNSISTSFDYEINAVIQSLSITQFSGYANPLSSMTASINSRYITVQFYQSDCSSTNTTSDFNMTFSDNASQLLSNCSNYNNPSNSFKPNNTFTSFHDLSVTGTYTVSVSASAPIDGNISSIGMELCYATNYLKITSSKYAAPGSSFSYSVILGISPYPETTANVTLSCDTGSVSDTFTVSTSDTTPHTFNIPNDASGTCTLTAESLIDPEFIASDLKVLTITNETVVAIVNPRSGDTRFAKQPIEVELVASAPLVNTTGTVYINCTVGSANATGEVPGRLNITSTSALYGDCFISVAPSAEYLVEDVVSIVINRKVTLQTPTPREILVAGQPFTVLITAPYATENDEAVLTIYCGAPFFQFHGKVDQAFYPTMNITAGGVCEARPTVLGDFYYTTRSSQVSILSPLVITKGLPNPSVGGQTYDVQVDTLGGNLNERFLLILDCQIGQKSVRTVPGRLTSFSIPDDLSGIGCTFKAQYLLWSFVETSQTLDVIMSQSTKDQAIQAIGPSNFANGVVMQTSQNNNRNQKSKKTKSRNFQ